MVKPTLQNVSACLFSVVVEGPKGCFLLVDFSATSDEGTETPKFSGNACVHTQWYYTACLILTNDDSEYVIPGV